MTLDIQSISYIGSREFTGSTVSPPGPLGYQLLMYSKALGIFPSIVFVINQWLGDSLLVCVAFQLVAWESEPGRSPSSIVVISSMP